MQLPVDIKAVLEEAVDVEAARQEPLSVSVYLDESAPADVQVHVRQAFASASETARVSLIYLDGREVVPYEGDDMACIVAGLSDRVGAAAAKLRSFGVPVMVVTTLPQLVDEIAAAAGHPIPQGDVVAPALTKLVYDHVSAPVAGAPALGASWGKPKPPVGGDTGAYEPIELIEEAARSLDEAMGAWVAEACRAKRLAFAWAFPFVRRPLATEVVRATAMQNAGVGLLVFIPGADMPVMTLNQAKMLLQVAAAYGKALDMERVKELAALVAGAFACRGVARKAAGAVPIVGLGVKVAVGYSATLAMGHAAIEYYEGLPSVAKVVEAAATARDGAFAAAAKVAADQARRSGASAVSSLRANAQRLACRAGSAIGRDRG